MDVLPAHLIRDFFRDSFKGLVALEIILDLPFGFPINNIISLVLLFVYPVFCRCPHVGLSHRIIVFGKHCECIAQKCTHLERLPPLASHLLLPSHCVLTRQRGKKMENRNLFLVSGIRTPNNTHQDSLIRRLS